MSAVMMKLFEPGNIGKLTIKNRIVMASMQVGGLIEPDGRLSQRGIDYYITRAKGGAGLIITTAVRPRGFENLPLAPLGAGLMADSTMYASRLNELANGVHDYGAKVAVQFTPGRGRNTRGWILKNAGAVAPSPLPCFFDSRITARELTIEEIHQIVQSLEYPAQVVSSSGIDAIEINCHAGYLADEFMTTLWNKRTDKYGGNLENRLRFLLEIIASIRKGAGEHFPMIIKFGLKHYLEGGREVEEGIEIARRLEAAGIDALEVDAGCYETMYWHIPSTYQAPACNLGLAEMVKKAVNIPVISVGKLGYPELAEEALQKGKADFIALGRPLLADPEWPNKVKERRFQDIRPCIGDLEGCLVRAFEGKYTSCTVNPTTGIERDLDIRPAEEKKSVLVVGGGPSGMEAARVAAIRGHKVTLWEKSIALGGNLIPASVPQWKQDYKKFLSYLLNQIEKLQVTIELEKEATSGLILEMKPDVVLIATGSIPITPEILGLERQNVASAVDVLLGKKKVGKSVAVVGGGLIGCETALYLAEKGGNLTLIEALDSLISKEYWVNRMHLLKLLADANVKILPETNALEITEEGLVIDKHNRQSTLKVDTIVLAVGMKPNDDLLEALQGKVPQVYAIGDCVEPRKLINAIWEGFRTARLI